MLKTLGRTKKKKLELLFLEENTKHVSLINYKYIYINICIVIYLFKENDKKQHY